MLSEALEKAAKEAERLEAELVDIHIRQEKQNAAVNNLILSIQEAISRYNYDRSM